MMQQADSRMARVSKFFKELPFPAVYLILMVTFLLSWLLVSLFGRGDFVSGSSLANMGVRSVALGIVAIGQTFVIIVASIDLSVAYLISVTAVIASFIMQGDPNNIPMALAVVFAIGIFVGTTNGLIITRLKVNPLIATLGTGLVMRGILNASFNNFAGSVPESFRFLGYETLGPVPVALILLAAVVLLSAFILTRTKFGAHLYSTGGDEETARLSGIRTNQIIIGAHIICSVTAVMTGLFIVSRTGSGAPWLGPDGVYDLESIAVAVLGGAALSGGKGSVWGTLAGVFIFAILDTLFNQIGMDTYLKQVLRGAIIIIAVAAYTARSREEAA
jgi:ribose transport system permease protein